MTLPLKPKDSLYILLAVVGAEVVKAQAISQGSLMEHHLPSNQNS